MTQPTTAAPSRQDVNSTPVRSTGAKAKRDAQRRQWEERQTVRQLVEQTVEVQFPGFKKGDWKGFTNFWANWTLSLPAEDAALVARQPDAFIQAVLDFSTTTGPTTTKTKYTHDLRDLLRERIPLLQTEWQR